MCSECSYGSEVLSEIQFLFKMNKYFWIHAFVPQTAEHFPGHTFSPHVGPFQEFFLWGTSIRL
jgi:hypothetical protein